ncbi:MAG: hypothetical protein QOG73_2651, partial [Acetobacteraceae bacterium]|nr:hypothetical protein [Acetobacteraceae bacterium]
VGEQLALMHQDAKTAEGHAPGSIRSRALDPPDVRCSGHTANEKVSRT